MKPVFWLIAMLLVVFLPVFTHLSEIPVFMWDESRLVTSAHEMLISGNWLVTTFKYQPDMWSTKPPIMIWLIALSIKTFGYSELAFRLPSALAAITTFSFLFWFCSKKLNDKRLALLTCFILVTCGGYINLHRTRTADYDALLTFFTTAYCLCYFLYLRYGDKRYFTAFIVALILATLVKGVAALLFLPAIIIYTIVSGQAGKQLKSKALYTDMAAFLFFVIGYYLLREHYNPGYIQAVWENELGGRYTTVLESHDHPWYFYLKFMATQHMNWWYLLLPFAIITGALSKNATLKSLTGYMVLLSFTFLLIISCSQTKLVWYDMPVYPFLAILIAIFLNHIFETIMAADAGKVLRISLVSFIILLMLGFPYLGMVNNCANQGTEDWDQHNYAMDKYLSDALHGDRNIKGYIFTEDSLEDQNINCYFEILQSLYGVQHKNSDSFQPGDKIIAFKQQLTKQIEDSYDVTVLYNSYVKVYRINGIKP